MKFSAFTWRGFAFIFDLSLMFWPYQIMLSVPSLEYYQVKLDNFLFSLIQSTNINFLNAVGAKQYVELFSCSLMVVFITQVMRVYTTFLLGRTIGQLIVGVYAEGSFWWKRISGIFRLVIEFFLLPFLFSHLLILIKGKSLHEKLGQNTLRIALRRFRLPVIVLCCFLSAGLILSSPLALNLSGFHEFTFNSDKISHAGIKDDQNFSNYKEYSSKVFGINVFTALELNKKFYFFPSLEIKKVGKRMLKSPVLYLIDRSNLSIAKMSIERGYRAHKILNKVLYANPLFHQHYELLSDLLLKKQNLKDFDGEEFGINQEFAKLINQIFSVSFKSLMSSTFSLGPVLLGPSKFRKNILQYLSSTSPVQIQSIEIGKNQFLRFQQLFEKGDHDNFGYQETYIPLNLFLGEVIQIKWQGDRSSSESRDHFEKQFLATMNLAKSSWDDRIYPEENWTCFDTLDALFDTSLSDENIHKLKTSLLASLSNTLELNKELKNKNLEKLVLQSINRYLFLQKNINGKLSDPIFKNALIAIKEEFFND